MHPTPTLTSAPTTSRLKSREEPGRAWGGVTTGRDALGLTLTSRGAGTSEGSEGGGQAGRLLGTRSKRRTTF